MAKQLRKSTDGESWRTVRKHIALDHALGAFAQAAYGMLGVLLIDLAAGSGEVTVTIKNPSPRQLVMTAVKAITASQVTVLLVERNPKTYQTLLAQMHEFCCHRMGMTKVSAHEFTRNHVRVLCLQQDSRLLDVSAYDDHNAVFLVDDTNYAAHTVLTVDLLAKVLPQADVFWAFQALGINAVGNSTKPAMRGFSHQMEQLALTCAEHHVEPTSLFAVGDPHHWVFISWTRRVHVDAAIHAFNGFRGYAKDALRVQGWHCELFVYCGAWKLSECLSKWVGLVLNDIFPLHEPVLSRFGGKRYTGGATARKRLSKYIREQLREAADHVIIDLTEEEL